MTSRMRLWAPAFLVALAGLVLTVLPGGLARADSLGDVVVSDPNYQNFAMAPDGARMYAPSPSPSRVDVIDPASGTVIDSIAMAVSPSYVVLSPDGSRLYVLSRNSGTLTVFNAATKAVISTISLPWYVESFGITPAGDYLLVSSPSSDLVAIYQTSDNTYVDEVPVAGSPIHVGFAAGKAYVSLWNAYSVAVIDLATFAEEPEISVQTRPYYSIAHPSGERMYVANYEDESISVINTASGSVVATIAVGTTPAHMAVTPDGSRLYVALYDGYGVAVIDTASNTVIQTLETPSRAWSLAIHPTLPEGYVGVPGNSVLRILFDVAPEVTTTALPAAAVGSEYSQAVAVTGSPAPTFAVTGGSLPPGLSLDAATGVISGTPTTTGLFAFTVTASNVVYGDPMSDSQELVITVAMPATGADPAPLALASAALLAIGAAALLVRRRASWSSLADCNIGRAPRVHS